MNFPGIIRILAIILLMCMLPCNSYSQIIEGEGNVVSEIMEGTEQNVDSKKSIWDKLKFWERINFKIFKFKRGENDTLDIVKVDKVVKGPKMNTQISVGTNLLSWAYFGTANLETSINIGKHFSAFVGGRYNAFKFETKAYKEIFHNQITGYSGVKWWPWFVNSGWWIGAKGQYSNFSNAGVFSSYQKDGVAVGGGILGGYAFMLDNHFNLEIGAGIWGGTYLKYSDYETPGNKPAMFVKVDNIQMSLIYFF